MLLVWWEHNQEPAVLRQSNRIQPQQWGNSLLKNKGLFLLSQSHIVALNQEQQFCSAQNGAEEVQDAGRTHTTAQVHSRTPAQAAPFPAPHLLTSVGAAKDAQWEKNNSPDPWLHEGKQSPFPLLPGRAAEPWINTAELLWLLVLAVLHARLPGL